MPPPPWLPEQVSPVKCPECGNLTGKIHHAPGSPPGGDFTVTLACGGCAAAFELLATSYCAGIRVGVLLEQMRRAEADEAEPPPPAATEEPQHPLTCNFCSHAPATRLLVADLSTGRTVNLVCGPCGTRNVADARTIAKSVPSAWLFVLTPAAGNSSADRSPGTR